MKKTKNKSKAFFEFFYDLTDSTKFPQNTVPKYKYFLSQRYEQLPSC